MYTRKHDNAFRHCSQVTKTEVITIGEIRSKRVLREQTKGQSALEALIVYNTESDLCKVFNMVQRYVIFCLTDNMLLN
jgi:hypothetical protein